MLSDNSHKKVFASLWLQQPEMPSGLRTLLLREQRFNTGGVKHWSPLCVEWIVTGSTSGGDDVTTANVTCKSGRVPLPLVRVLAMSHARVPAHAGPRPGFHGTWQAKYSSGEVPAEFIILPRLLLQSVISIFPAILHSSEHALNLQDTTNAAMPGCRGCH